ncbi:branched-chain amino acid ABC transporter permease [Herbaspirillum lusitanum]|uniref:branched-chain amino acid ABC transporter permease n=1 Tax=Herbaspirillum lusitanum TaxID=213312 RepID=UPI00031F3F40|nr:branched-chain amino acid ABC transporter permease [Herbaspirillum lusitanum]
MSTFIITSLNALSFGLLLFLLSAGLTLIFSMMGVLNFAHASFYMLGAYVAYTFGAKVGFFPALILAPIAMGAVGMLVERFGLRKVHMHGHVAELLFTFGLAQIIEELVHLIWGRAPVSYPMPDILSGSLFTVMGAPFPAYRAFIMCVAVGVLALLYFTITRTRVGLIIQAALTHPTMAEALGHNVPRIFMSVFGVGVGLAALAGAVGAPAAVTEPAMAHAVGSIVFVIIVLGGIGSLAGAFAASILIGFIQTFAVLVDASPYQLISSLGNDSLSNLMNIELFKITVAQLGPVLPFFVMVAVLVLRPRGMFGKRES